MEFRTTLITSKPLSIIVWLIATVIVTVLVALTFGPSHSPQRKYFDQTLWRRRVIARQISELRSQSTRPMTIEELRQAIREAKDVGEQGMIDGWGTPFQFTFQREYGDGVVEIRSAGGDRIFNTADDVPASEYWGDEP